MDKHEYAALVAALRCQRQIDEDGSEIAISREAADVAADVIEKLAAGTHVVCLAQPVAWVDVEHPVKGPYVYNGMDLMPRGKHHLYRRDETS